MPKLGRGKRRVVLVCNSSLQDQLPAELRETQLAAIIHNLEYWFGSTGFGDYTDLQYKDDCGVTGFTWRVWEISYKHSSEDNLWVRKRNLPADSPINKPLASTERVIDQAKVKIQLNKEGSWFIRVEHYTYILDTSSIISTTERRHNAWVYNEKRPRKKLQYFFDPAGNLVKEKELPV